MGSTNQAETKHKGLEAGVATCQVTAVTDAEEPNHYQAGKA